MKFVPSLIGFFAIAQAAAQSPRPAEHGSHPSVSPNGRTIAFFSNRDGPLALYVMSVDGSAVRRISGEHQVESGRPAWTPDASHVVIGGRAGDTAIAVSFPLAGGEPAVVSRIVAKGGSSPSPDLTRFVYGTGDWREMQLEIARADGSDPHRLTNDHAAHWCPQISPSGDRIAVGRRDSGAMQIWVINADGSNGSSLTRFTSADGSAECPAWSPDGRRIAFQSGVRAPGATKTSAHIWVVDVATRRATKLAPHSMPWQDETPAWFPDGKRIAFQSDRTGAWEVWVMSADGSEQRQLTR